jgi:hypothetical protein
VAPNEVKLGAKNGGKLTATVFTLAEFSGNDSVAVNPVSDPAVGVIAATSNELGANETVLQSVTM